jgi:transposase InsO family protein
VATLIAACSTCQKVRLRSSSDQPPPSGTAVYRAFHTLSVDFLGPFPADPEGNRFILVAVCAFTRWCCLFVTKDATASSAVTALLHVFGTFGAFRHLRSDQGPHFTAAVVAEFCSALNVKQDFTIAFRPQANGIVERANGEVPRHLRALVADFRSYDSWATFVPLVQRLLNATPCSSTGFSPATLVFGGLVDLNRGFLDPLVTSDPPPDGEFSTDDYVQSLRDSQRRLLAAAAEFQVKVVDRRLAASSPTSPRVFDVGDFVVVSHPDRAPTKLSPPWFGPLQVVQRLGSNSYLLRDLVTGSERHLSAARLKLFNAATTPFPRAVAAADVGEYSVEAIVDHRLKRGTAAPEGLSFRVRYRGYGPDEDRWLPFADANDLAALDDYALQHPELGL